MDFFQEMSEPTQKFVLINTIESLFTFSGSPSEVRVLKNDTEISSTNREQMKRNDKSSDRKTTNSQSLQTQLKMGQCFTIFVANRRIKANLFGLAGCTDFLTSTLLHGLATL